jgi:hypothetical protein
MYSAEEHVTFLKKKSEAFDSFRKYEAWLKKQRYPDGIKCYGSNGKGEFTSTEFNSHLEREGMVRHTSFMILLNPMALWSEATERISSTCNR